MWHKTITEIESNTSLIWFLVFVFMFMLVFMSVSAVLSTAASVTSVLLPPLYSVFLPSRSTPLSVPTSRSISLATSFPVLAPFSLLTLFVSALILLTFFTATTPEMVPTHCFVSIHCFTTLLVSAIIWVIYQLGVLLCRVFSFLLILFQDLSEIFCLILDDLFYDLKQFMKNFVLIEKQLQTTSKAAFKEVRSWYQMY